MYVAQPTMRRAAAGVLLACTMLACTAPAQTIAYVDAGATGANDGTCWGDASTRLQPAIDAVEAAGGGEVWVAAGTYVPSPAADENSTFRLRPGVALYGGFSGTETAREQRDWEDNPTVLGDDTYRTNTLQGALGAVLDGFIVRYTDTGLNNVNASPTLANCVFTPPESLFGRFAVLNRGSSWLLAENCVFVGGSLLTQGRGAGNVLRDCIFIESQVSVFEAPAVLTSCVFYGRGICIEARYPGTGEFARLTDCVIDGAGSGVDLINSEATLAGCTITNSRGHGVNIEGSPSIVRLRQCTIAGSRGAGARVDGSPMVEFESCVFYGNAGVQGGALQCERAGNVRLVNCTIAGNWAEVGGVVYAPANGTAVQLLNSVVWGNDSSGGLFFGQPDSFIRSQASCIQGAWPSGPGDIHVDPLFLNPADPDGPDDVWGTDDDGLRLRNGSPCINGGNNAIMNPGTTADLAGNPRIRAGIVDMGAYEGPAVAIEANAGDDLRICSFEQESTSVVGTATSSQPGSAEFRWVEGGNVLAGWVALPDGGEARLDLGLLPLFSPGEHALTLEVRQAGVIASDDAILMVDNSVPEARPGPTSQVVEYAVDTIRLVANVSDFDGDTLAYSWAQVIAVLGDGTVMTEPLADGTVETVKGGDQVALPDLLLPPGDERFPVSDDPYWVQLTVADGLNPAVTKTVHVTVSDTTGPSVQPVSDTTILWPPNHELREVTIEAKAFDNGGGTVSLTVSVSSSEPPDADADGNTTQDWYIDSTDDAAGIIRLRLRAERARKGDGRVYTVTVTATDESGNESVATVEIAAPHDRRKK